MMMKHTPLGAPAQQQQAITAYAAVRNCTMPTVPAADPASAEPLQHAAPHALPATHTLQATAARSRAGSTCGLAMMASTRPYSMASWGDMKKSRSVSRVMVSMDWPVNCAR